MGVFDCTKYPRTYSKVYSLVFPSDKQTAVNKLSHGISTKNVLHSHSHPIYCFIQVKKVESHNH